MEAQRVISVSLGKIAQSRVQRSGCSLHKSLMVASILQKARHLYVEQAFMMHCRPQQPPAASPAPATGETAPTYTDLDTCSPAERGAASGPATADAATATAAAAEPTRRKRLISDEETEEAVASILPKRARTESCGGDDEAAPVPTSASPAAESVSTSSSDPKDADSDDSDDSCYESGDSDDSEADAMEIDRITSLVSVFSFDSLKLRQKQTAADSCSSQRTGEWDLTGSDPVAVRA